MEARKRRVRVELRAQRGQERVIFAARPAESEEVVRCCRGLVLRQRGHCVADLVGGGVFFLDADHAEIDDGGRGGRCGGTGLSPLASFSITDGLPTE